MSSLKGLAPLRIPLKEIVSATNDFAHENLIGQGGLGKVYKGKLSWSEQFINVAVRRLDRKYGHGVAEFWTDILMLSSLKHENVVSVVGFCDENHEKIIVYSLEVHGSLDKYLADPTLTWVRRLQICVGVARALSYIHYDVGCNYSVIHRNIKSSKILLDNNWEAKISGFGLSVKNSVTRRHRLLLTRLSGTVGYVDPAYEKTGGVTHKSDVFSFGVVLFEVLCGRKAFIPNKENEFLAQLAKFHYEEKKLDDMIDPNLWKQMDLQSFNIFSETAYCCLKEQRTQRPNMDQIVKRLEQALDLQWKHENPEHSTLAVEGISSNHLKKNLEHLKIPLTDIELATENFAKTYCIGSGGYGMVYKAELDHFDYRSSLLIEGENKVELPKRRNTVAIKRIFSREDGQGEQGFLAEIEMLTSCKHHNIVSLLGFCDEGPQMILVYEHASNGSLDDYLGSNFSVINLTWAQRIKMCLDIAHGLNYLHTRMEDKQRIIHRDIKSANILLDENWEAKIADFGLSKFHPMNQQASTLNTNNIAGTEVYLDPEYMKTGKLKKESDIYSFGVVLFEILCGRLAYDEIYNVDNEKGLPSFTRRCFKEGTLKEMIDPKIMEETDLNIFTLNKGPDQDSLDTFVTIGYQCLAETQAERPTMEVIIKELEKALYFQENRKDILQISLEDIKLATNNFSDNNSIGRGGFAKIYKGEVPHANGHTTIVAKRLDRSLGQGEHEFLTELEILFEYKHENIIGLVGYCTEMDEKIIVSEYASKGSLDRYLNDVSLTWMKRLKICIDLASVLDFLHGGVVTQERVIHRDIKSSNILLNGDWKAKLCDFGLSLISPLNHEMEYVIDNVAGTMGYLDPLYMSTGFLTKESDIYSFGVVLFEILCGRLAVHWDTHNYERRSLTNIVKHNFKEGKSDEIVFEGIKEQIVPNSLNAFLLIAYQCLHDERERRPTAHEVVVQLKKALEFQEDYDIWEPKLPRDYNEIISKSIVICSTEKKKDLYNLFAKGILLQEGKVLFSLGTNGERNEMISARTFSYKNHRSRKWRSTPKSRFHKVAEMIDISNLKIQIKIRTQFLSPGVNYGVHLVFKFCGPRKFTGKPMYVNLKYKMRKETLHAYFATWRDDEWMMIELCRFLNHKEATDFEVLLESFSRYYCGSGAIYVEGIQFQAIDNLKDEEIKKLKEVQQVMKSNSNMDRLQQLPTANNEDISKRSKNYGEDALNPSKQLIWLTEEKGKKHLMLSAKEVVCDFSNMKLLNSKHSTSSRFEEVIELRSQQVFRIKCKIESQMLSPDTDYACYLVFKLSENCRGLHCPVKVRDLLRRKNKDTEIVYFRSPSPWNLHDNYGVPKRRGDGWTEVNVWKFNSNYELKNDCLPIDLKLISYEGTMCGLIICGLEYRPI